MVTIYTLPSCPQCETTKRFLTRQGIEYKEVNLSEDAEATEMIKQLGYVSAPVIIAGDLHWSGFRLERLQQLAA
jgi:glutaredoxin-like protein NrdH